MSRRVIHPPGFYLQDPPPDLRSETPPSLRSTHARTQSRTSCPNCGDIILMSSLPAGTQSVPTLSRSNAVVGTTPPNTRPTVSSYRGRFKTGWTQNLLKRCVPRDTLMTSLTLTDFQLGAGRLTQGPHARRGKQNGEDPMGAVIR